MVRVLDKKFTHNQKRPRYIDVLDKSSHAEDVIVTATEFVKDKSEDVLKAGSV